MDRLGEDQLVCEKVTFNVQLLFTLNKCKVRIGEIYIGRVLFL